MQTLQYDAESKLYAYISGTKLNTSVISSLDAYEYLHAFFSFTVFSNQREKFVALYLDGNNFPIGQCRFSHPDKPFVVVELQKLIDEAVAVSAAKIWIGHNSRTSNTSPTLQDDELTKHFIQECKSHNLEVVDYLIISEYGHYYSYADNGKLPL